MERIGNHCKTIILAAFLGIILILAIVFAILTAWSWNNLLSQTYYPDTTTFIGSSDVVQLGCYPGNTVQSVTINKTGSTVVYLSDRSSNLAFVNIKLNETKPRHLTQGPFKFPVYYYHDEVAIYTVKNGQIFLNFSVQKIEITNNCTLEIFLFDSYFECTKFLNTGEMFKSINRTCLTTKNIKDVFMVNFTLPSTQYTYIAALAIGVKEMNYSTVGGSVTTYDTSNYKQECTDNADDNTCSVKIGGRVGTSSRERCVYVDQVLEDSTENYMFVKAEITKVNANLQTVSLTSLFVFFVLFLIFFKPSLGIYIRCKRKCARRSPTEETSLNIPRIYGSTSDTTPPYSYPDEQETSSL